jgi:hypothetical protein
MTDLPLERQEARVRLFRRLLVSYNDFEQSSHLSSHILNAKLHDRYPEQDRHVLQALNCAMIVAYARPFSINRGSSNTLPSLPSRFLKTLAHDERELHRIVIRDRNEVLAHSDASAWNLRLGFIRTGERAILAPIHHDTRAPLTEQSTRLLDGMAVKLMERVFAERMLLEKELIGLLPTISVDDGSIAGDEVALRYGGWTTRDAPGDDGSA